MNLSEAVVLSLVQALTEFLPISSFGHLVLIENIFGYKSESILFDLIVHLGTVLSVLVYFRNFIAEAIKNIRILKLLALSTAFTAAPSIIILKFFRTEIKELKLVSLSFFITALLLFSMDYFKNLKKEVNTMSYKDAALIGIAQSLSILPGISRTGVTTFSALILGLKRSDAAKYSLILAIPTIFGAFSLEFMEYREVVVVNAEIYIVALILSFIFGLISIRIFIEFLMKRRFKIFGIYCILVGIVSVFLF